AIFAKGINAEKMIIISNMKGQLDTIYRVRALLATMTAVARKSPVLRKVRLENVLTFLDLSKMLGFKQITISDGDKFSHQVFLK
ncbi:MAG: molybdopterin-guanine dinucleotide biosynthesis protein A, partial [Rhodospirillales bacterium]